MFRADMSWQVGALLTDYSLASQWAAVFWVSAGVHVLGSLTYLLGGSAEVQDWAREGEGEGEKGEQDALELPHVMAAVEKDR